MHIDTLVRLGQWLGYLITPWKHCLILTSSTQLSKKYYLKLRLISYCNFFLLWLRQKCVMFILHYGISSELEENFNSHSEADPFRLSHIFLLPLGRGAWCLACVQVYLQYQGFNYKPTYKMTCMYVFLWCHIFVLLIIESGSHILDHQVSNNSFSHIFTKKKIFRPSTLFPIQIGEVFL